MPVELIGACILFVPYRFLGLRERINYLHITTYRYGGRFVSWFERLLRPHLEDYSHSGYASNWKFSDSKEVWWGCRGVIAQFTNPIAMLLSCAVNYVFLMLLAVAIKTWFHSFWFFRLKDTLP